MSLPRLDIVIPSAGRPDDLLRLLDDLARLSGESGAAASVRVTVSDDRPSEGAARRVAERHPAVRYVHGPARGPAANRNHAASQGDASWILFLDDDCYPASDLVGVLAGVLAADAALEYVEGAIRPEGPRPSPNHHAPINLVGGRLWACNMAVRRATFERLGGFDERFPFAAMEDCDLRERLQDSGARGRFEPAMAVVHPWRNLSERELWKQIVSHAIMAEKHPAFRRNWSVANLLRMARGRVRNLAEGRLAAITWARARTQVYFTVLPLALFAVVRWPWLRSRLALRYANPAVRSDSAVPIHPSEVQP